MTSIPASPSVPQAITTQPQPSAINNEELNPLSVEQSAPISLSDVDPAVVTTQPLINPEEKMKETEKRFNQFNPTVNPIPTPPPAQSNDSAICCLTCLDCLDCSLECGACCVDCGECCGDCCTDFCEGCGNCCTGCCENGAGADAVDSNTIGDCAECLSCLECCSN